MCGRGQVRWEAGSIGTAGYRPTMQPPRSRPALTEAPESGLRPEGAKLCRGERGRGGGQLGGLLRSRHRQQGPPQVPDTRLFFQFPPIDSEESGMASGRKTCSVTSQMDRASPQGCTEVKALSLQGKTVNNISEPKDQQDTCSEFS